MSTLNKNNPIAKAVKYALLATAGVSVLSTPVVFAADEDEDEERNTVTITGSRIKRTDIEIAQPITIITREELDLSGDTSAADAIRNQSANSFGSWKGQSGYGSGATGSAEVNLRGVGATLVLVDGRRMPGVGYDGGATQNLNNIPLAIVERIEILRGGASAIYGSDAVAGVVNIITRKEIEGGSITALYENRGIDDGTNNKYEFTAGIAGDKGNILVVAEHSSSEQLDDNAVSGFDNGVSWFSPVPNTIFYDADIGWTSRWDDELCGAIPNTVPDPAAYGTGRCGYAYSNATWLYPDQETDSIWTKFNYELTDNIELHARLGYVGTKTHSRYAPTPISTSIPTLAPDSALVPADVNSLSLLYIYHRSALLGNRDAYFNDSSYDLVFGLEGFLDMGNGFDWEANYQRTLKDEILMNHNLINDVAFQAGLDNEEYDLFNVAGMSAADWSQHALDFYKSVAHTGIFEVHQVREIIDGNFGGEIFSNDTFNLNFVVGGEFESTDFTQISDPESGEGFISGGSGGDDVFANRDRTSIYTEFAMNFDFGLELTAAARYDEYDQTGDIGLSSETRNFSDTTTMVTALYRPMDNLLIRAVVGEAFRAPTMPELFASNSFSFPSGYDYYYCDTLNGGANGLGGASYDASYCDPSNQPQHLAFYGGNPSLLSEHGDTMSAGVVWNVTDDLVLEAGWYDIEYFDKITNVSINEILIQNNIAGGTSAAVTRANNGQIATIQAGSLNLAIQETSGYDLAAAYSLETDMGRFVFKGDLTRVSEFFNVQIDDDGTEIRNDIVGFHDVPETKANLTVSWSKDDYYAAWRLNYIAGQDAQSDNFRDIDAVTTHNLQFGAYLPWQGEIVVGIRNVTDNEIETYTDDMAWRNYSATLYNPEGRTWFVRYTQDF